MPSKTHNKGKTMHTKNLGIPMIYTKEGQTTLSFDIYSQLLNNRIIMLDDEINNHSASVVVAQLLYLNSLNDEQIDLYINSPGGCVSSGLSIIDTMNFIKAPVSTICTGMAASMAAVILACGKKGVIKYTFEYILCSRKRIKTRLTPLRSHDPSTPWRC